MKADFTERWPDAPGRTVDHNLTRKDMFPFIWIRERITVVSEGRSWAITPHVLFKSNCIATRQRRETGKTHPSEAVAKPLANPIWIQHPQVDMATIGKQSASFTSIKAANSGVIVTPIKWIIWTRRCIMEGLFEYSKVNVDQYRWTGEVNHALVSFWLMQVQRSCKLAMCKSGNFVIYVQGVWPEVYIELMKMKTWSEKSRSNNIHDFKNE